MSATDSVLRTMTDDGTFRVITAKTTETVRGALEAQNVRGSTAQALGDLLTGVVLVRETMAPQLRVQGILRGAERTGTLVADSHPTGKTRGLCTQPKSKDRADVQLGHGAVLQLMRTLHDGRLHQGIVEVPQAGGISEALMTYMQISEQVTTMVGVGTLFEGDRVVSAGGYLIQLLPGALRGPLMIMTERLESLPAMKQQLEQPGYSPTALMDELLYAMPFTRLGESDVRFECWCSLLGVMSALSTLPRAEVQDMVSAGEVLEISCDYCQHEYRVSPTELKGLLTES